MRDPSNRQRESAVGAIGNMQINFRKKHTHFFLKKFFYGSPVAGEQLEVVAAIAKSHHRQRVCSMRFAPGVFRQKRESFISSF